MPGHRGQARSGGARAPSTILRQFLKSCDSVVTRSSGLPSTGLIQVSAAFHRLKIMGPMTLPGRTTL